MQTTHGLRPSVQATQILETILYLGEAKLNNLAVGHLPTDINVLGWICIWHEERGIGCRLVGHDQDLGLPQSLNWLVDILL